jgi:hypothetical protein
MRFCLTFILNVIFATLFILSSNAQNNCYSTSEYSVGYWGKEWNKNKNSSKDRAYSYNLPKLLNGNFYTKKNGPSPFYFLSYDGSIRHDITNGSVYEYYSDYKFNSRPEILAINTNIYHQHLHLAELPIILEDIQNILQSFSSEECQIVYNIRDNKIMNETQTWSDGLIIEKNYNHENFIDENGEEMIEHYPAITNYYHSFKKNFLSLFYDKNVCSYCENSTYNLNAKKGIPLYAENITTYYDNLCISSSISFKDSITDVKVYKNNYSLPIVKAKLKVVNRKYYTGAPSYYKLINSDVDDKNSIDKFGYISKGLTINDEYVIDEYNLIEYWNLFIKFCKNHGVFLNEKPNDINIYFDNLSNGVLAEAHAIDDDSKILIKVNPVEWKNSSNQKKIYIMFHELFHDAFNLRHGHGGKMMFCFAEKDYNWYNLFNDTIEILDFLKSNHGMKSLDNYYVVDVYF